LENLVQRIGYLATKKAELQTPIQELRARIMFTRQEKNELKPTYEKCEYQTVEDLLEQIDSIASCTEY